MPKGTVAQPQKLRLCVDLDLDLRRRLWMAAAGADVSLKEYLLQAISEKLDRDLTEREELLPLSTKTDPVLAELWDNEEDAAYDRL